MIRLKALCARSAGEGWRPAGSCSSTVWFAAVGLAGCLVLAVAIVTGSQNAVAQSKFKNEARIIRQLKLPPGFRINLFAFKLGAARLMALTPDGDIILSSPPSKILLVRADGNSDGRSDGVKTLLNKLSAPHGVWLDGEWLYIAEQARVFRIRYASKTRTVSGKKEILVSGIPNDGGHWTRTIKKGPDGWFYVTIGSSCNVCIEKHSWRAAMIRFRPGEKPQLYASGLRNSVGFDWRPATGELFAVDNGRDWLGDNFPPGELNHIVEGGFYGWPFFHGANEPDPKFGKRGGAFKKTARAPAFGFSAHVAPLSVRFLRNTKSKLLKDAALVAQHGSWNRSSKIGYRLVSMHWYRDGSIARKPFLTGFEKKGKVIGRPVDIIEAPDGTLFVTDDYLGGIWRIVYEGDAAQ